MEKLISYPEHFIYLSELNYYYYLPHWDCSFLLLVTPVIFILYHQFLFIAFAFFIFIFIIFKQPKELVVVLTLKIYFNYYNLCFNVIHLGSYQMYYSLSQDYLV